MANLAFGANTLVALDPQSTHEHGISPTPTKKHGGQQPPFGGACEGRSGPPFDFGMGSSLRRTDARDARGAPQSLWFELVRKWDTFASPECLETSALLEQCNHLESLL